MAIGRDILFEYLCGLLFGVPGTNEVPLIDDTTAQGWVGEW
jgi:hypothetical protein